MKEKQLPEWFTEEMERVLQEKRSEKSDWKEERLDDLIRGMEDQQRELFDFYEIFDADRAEDRMRVARRCVHIANYAMMIADKMT